MMQQARPSDRVERALPIEAVLAISDGKIVDAIKIIREREGSDLANAKARVDRYLAQNPLIKDQLKERMRVARGKFIRWVLIADAALLLAVLYWMFGR
jgi:ribosomal protein L7/L12